VLSAQTPRARCWPRKAGPPPQQAGLEWVASKSPRWHHHYSPTPTPSFATSVGLTWRGLPRGSIEAPPCASAYWAGPRIWVPGANDPGPSGERLQRSGRVAVAPASPTTGSEPARHKATPSSACSPTAPVGVRRGRASGGGGVWAFVAAGSARWLLDAALEWDNRQPVCGSLSRPGVGW